MSLKLKIIIGSTRPGRVGPSVASWVHEAAKAQDAFEVELVELAEFDLPLLDEPKHPAMQQYQHEHTKRWSAAMADGDAYVFVTPEYDFFAPASLVNALQCLAVEWRYKPAGTVCYGGVTGGLRSSQEVRQLIGNKNMMPLPQVVPVPFVASHIDEEGKFSATEKMNEGLKNMFRELAKWAGALKPMREK